MDRSSVRKWLLISAGFLSVGLAVAGVFLPLLPTTPFLLLAAACFVRSSDRFYRWLVGHRVFGPYITHYRKHRAITRRAKALTVILLWATIGYTSFFVVRSLPLRALLLLIAAGVTMHVLRLKTLTKEMLGEETVPEPHQESTRPTPDEDDLTESEGRS